MAKKKINMDKSWWAKISSGIVEAIKIAVDDKTKYINALGFYTAVMIIFCNRKNDEGFIRLSMVKSFLGFGYRTKTKMLESEIFNKWLFYTKKIVIDKDILIQPVIDVNKMSETKVNSLLQAIRFNDYDTLLKLSPNILDDKGNSKTLFEREKSSDENCSNGVPNGVSNGVSNEVSNEVSNGVPNGVPNEHQQRRARVNKRERERESERENKSFNQNQSINKEPIVGNNEPSCLVDCDKTTGFTEGIGLRSWKDYLDKLKADSKEGQCLISCAYDDAGFFEQNFDKFKDQLWNIIQLRGKFKDPNLLSNFRKNGYIVNLLRSPNERNRLIVIPRDAPPQPSPEHFWDFDYTLKPTKWAKRTSPQREPRGLDDVERKKLGVTQRITSRHSRTTHLEISKKFTNFVVQFKAKPC